MRINKEKTKVIKIGGWRDSGIELCKDLKLDSTSEFISLGISYKVNELDNITEYNIDDKLKEIKKLGGGFCRVLRFPPLLTTG